MRASAKAVSEGSKQRTQGYKVGRGQSSQEAKAGVGGDVCMAGKGAGSSPSRDES